MDRQEAPRGGTRPADRTVDAVVIGAGFAGITAARDLSERGHTVVQLEARDRPGGRTRLAEGLGRMLDFGGTYVHWTQAHVWHEMRRYGLDLHTPMPIERYHWLADGTVHSGGGADYADRCAPLVARCLADARARFPRPDAIAEPAGAGGPGGLTLRDRIDALGLDDHARDVLAGALSSLVCDESRQGLDQFLLWASIDGGHWDLFLEAAGHFPIEGGTGRLLDAMLADSTADLRLDTPVTAIADDGAAVTVTTAAGATVRARHAVVAAPLNTLSDIAFSPPLTGAVGTLVGEGHPMRTLKLWARVRGHITPFVGSAPAGKHVIATARTEYRHDGDTLVVCFCPDADALDPADPSAVQRALRLFVPDIEVVETAFHDWAADPWSQGTWAHHRPGALTGAVPLMREGAGRIRFAGGDISALGVGGIDGAIETGAEAARRVARALAHERTPVPAPSARGHAVVRGG